MEEEIYSKISLREIMIMIRLDILYFSQKRKRRHDGGDESGRYVNIDI